MSKQVGIFFQTLWTSPNIWTLIEGWKYILEISRQIIKTTLDQIEDDLVQTLKFIYSEKATKIWKKYPTLSWGYY